MYFAEVLLNGLVVLYFVLFFVLPWLPFGDILQTVFRVFLAVVFYGFWGSGQGSIGSDTLPQAGSRPFVFLTFDHKSELTP